MYSLQDYVLLYTLRLTFAPLSILKNELFPICWLPYTWTGNPRLRRQLVSSVTKIEDFVGTR